MNKPSDTTIKQLYEDMNLRRRKEWLQTPAGCLFKDSKATMTTARWAVQQAFGRGDIGGSILELEELVTGQQFISGFGETARFELARILFKLYKRKFVQ